MLKEGLTHTSFLVVKECDTAEHIGSGETLLGKGTHLRFIVNREKFLRKLEK